MPLLERLSERDKQTVAGANSASRASMVASSDHADFVITSLSLKEAFRYRRVP